MKYKVVASDILDGKYMEWDCSAPIKSKYINTYPIFNTDDVNIAYNYRADCQDLWPRTTFEVREYI